MSCNKYPIPSQTYPIPARTWGRRENPCAYIIQSDVSSGIVYVPFLKRYITLGKLQEEIAQVNKGNVLQYKKNSANLTKAQRYSLIAKGSWINRSKTYATQTDKYTNPNTNSLKRVNTTHITIAGIPTTRDVTPCPPINIIPPSSVLPSGSGSGTSNPPVLPPPVIPIPPVIDITIPYYQTIHPDPEPIVISDGGSLICNIVENQCNGQILQVYLQPHCFPTSDSDVPGPIELLCYNERFPQLQ